MLVTRLMPKMRKSGEPLRAFSLFIDDYLFGGSCGGPNGQFVNFSCAFFSFAILCNIYGSLISVLSGINAFLKNRAFSKFELVVRWWRR